jgi:hypothetical protein
VLRELAGERLVVDQPDGLEIGQRGVHLLRLEIGAEQPLSELGLAA